jgi:hypothetical protein
LEDTLNFMHILRCWTNCNNFLDQKLILS